MTFAKLSSVCINIYISYDHHTNSLTIKLEDPYLQLDRFTLDHFQKFFKVTTEPGNQIGSESDVDWINFEFITSGFGPHPYFLKQYLSKFDSSVHLSNSKETGTSIHFSVVIQPYARQE